MQYVVLIVALCVIVLCASAIPFAVAAMLSTPLTTDKSDTNA